MAIVERQYKQMDDRTSSVLNRFYHGYDEPASNEI
jgi:hypothetical protein